jgi:hypothetical protein
MLPAETIRSGAPATCPDCNITPDFQVYSSNAGYYIGTYCNCGPYTRESEYYESFAEAQNDLNYNNVRWRGGYQPSTFRRVAVHGYIELPNDIEVDELLGPHKISCVLSYNCDDYDRCVPASINIYHSHEAH